MKILIKSFSEKTMEISKRVFKIKHFEYNLDTKEVDIQLDGRGHLEFYGDNNGMLQIEKDVYRDEDGNEVEEDVVERVLGFKVFDESCGVLEFGPMLNKDEAMALCRCYFMS